MNPEFKISGHLLQGISDYLARRPYIEVAHFMGGLQQVEVLPPPKEPDLPKTSGDRQELRKKS